MFKCFVSLLVVMLCLRSIVWGSYPQIQVSGNVEQPTKWVEPFQQGDKKAVVNTCFLLKLSLNVLTVACFNRQSFKRNTWYFLGMCWVGLWALSTILPIFMLVLLTSTPSQERPGIDDEGPTLINNKSPSIIPWSALAIFLKNLIKK